MQVNIFINLPSSEEFTDLNEKHFKFATITITCFTKAYMLHSYCFEYNKMYDLK